MHLEKIAHKILFHVENIIEAAKPHCPLDYLQFSVSTIKYYHPTPSTNSPVHQPVLSAIIIAAAARIAIL